jgi:cytoskeletal protein CcmA (bactofilin family)
MFSKGSNTSSSSAPSPNAETGTAPPREQTQPRAPTGGTGAPSIISADLTIVGNLTSKGDIQIDGTIQGDVSSQSVTVGEAAVVEGTLSAATIRVYGKVRGEIRAEAVTLAQSANVEGNVLHKTLTMESGAMLTGRLGQLSSEGSSKDAAAVSSGGSSAPDPSAGGR